MHARLTAREGRRFAWTLAFGFAALGALAWWRGADLLHLPLLAIAAAALLAGALAPSHLGPASRAWMRLGVALSRITTPVFYSALYFLVVTPTGILRRTLGRSPLRRSRSAATYWIAREPTDAEAARRRLERQF